MSIKPNYIYGEDRNLFKNIKQKIGIFIFINQRQYMLFFSFEQESISIDVQTLKKRIQKKTYLIMDMYTLKPIPIVDIHYQIL